MDKHSPCGGSNRERVRPVVSTPEAPGARHRGSFALLAAAIAIGGCASLEPAPQHTAAAAAAADAPPPFAPPSPLAQCADPGDGLQPITVYTPRLQPLRDGNLLDELRTGLSLTVEDDPLINREIDWFAAHPQYLDRVFGRADSYIYYITRELEARDMPVDLALLPVVESAFDPFAYSHSRAAGLWQIIPGTGRRLGLEQNWWFDGRRDIVELTRAALDYLRDMHEEFNGDWLLAVAGYNAGAGNVERAIKRAEAAGGPTDFWGVKNYLPAETRTYVPRFLAICELVADPSKYEIELPKIANEPQFALVDTGGQIDMALAAELAGIDTDALYALNPGVNRWATDPDGPHRLLVPVDQAEHFESALAALGERERVQWTRHRVQRGETIGALADHYHTTAAVLRRVNELRGDTIIAGDYLMIPHALQSLDRYTQTADARAARQQHVARDGTRVSHVVASGESLWSIARRYDVNVRALAQWNAMAPGDTLSVGRELVVWTKNGSETVPAPTLRPAGVRQPANPQGRLRRPARRFAVIDRAAFPRHGAGARPVERPRRP